MSQIDALLTRPTKPLPPCIAITSGKGGVGKTSLVAHTASLLAQRGLKVLAIDADYGLANLALILGAAPRLTLEDAIEGRCALVDTVIEVRPGLSVLPGGSGTQRLGAMSRTAVRATLEATRPVASGHDLILIDTAAGIGPAVLATLDWASRVVVVLGADPASFVDAYAIVKLTLGDNPHKALGVIVNGARGRRHGAKLQDNFALVSQRFLGHRPTALGTIPHDPHLARAMRDQQLVCDTHPDSPAALALDAFADALADGSPQALTRPQLLEEDSIWQTNLAIF